MQNSPRLREALEELWLVTGGERGVRWSPN